MTHQSDHLVCPQVVPRTFVLGLLLNVCRVKEPDRASELSVESSRAGCHGTLDSVRTRCPLVGGLRRPPQSLHVSQERSSIEAGSVISAASVLKTPPPLRRAARPHGVTLLLTQALKQSACTSNSHRDPPPTLNPTLTPAASMDGGVLNLGGATTGLQSEAAQLQDLGLKTVQQPPGHPPAPLQEQSGHQRPTAAGCHGDQQTHCRQQTGKPERTNTC